MNRIIEWFVHNTVTANLLMMSIIVMGLVSVSSVKQEVFPEASLDMVSVSVVYRGAAPEEVEEGVCVRVEEAIQDIEGIKRISSTAQENNGSVMVEIKTGYDVSKVMEDIKSRVDAIDTFPEETDKPVVSEMMNRTQVINIAVSGETDKKTLKKLAEAVREDLLALDDITQVSVTNTAPYEISIEVSENALRRYNLTFNEVARAIQMSSLDLPGGSVKTSAGEILLRTKGQAYNGEQFGNIILRSYPDGTRLFLKEVANVNDGFEETDQNARFDGKPAAIIQVFRVGDESALTIAESVSKYVDIKQKLLPEGIKLTTWQDDTKILKSRMDLLFRNGVQGLILVFIALALFLKLRLAGWVSLGLVISFMGALWMMPILNVSINLLSLFAFILVLGVVVDDAIVIGENVFTKIEKGMSPVRAAIEGTQEVAVPVVFAVLTTFAAFAPLLLVEGMFGKFMRVIPLIVIGTLSFSLIESLLVLPSHLAHSKIDPHKKTKGWWQKIQTGFSDKLKWFVETKYKPSLDFALKWRYATMASGLAVLLISIGMAAGGWMSFTFFPKVEADNVVALLTMPQGTPVEMTEAAIRKIEQVALDMEQEFEKEGEVGLLRHVLTSVGEQPFKIRQNRSQANKKSGLTGAHLAEVNIELKASEERNVSSQEIVRRWREGVGSIPDAVELSFTSSIFSTGEAINIEFSGNDYDALNAASAETKKKLSTYNGVFDIADSYRAGKREIKLKITPQAEAAGLTLADLARQVRQAFYGDEAQRIQRGRDDIRVMVRYPEDKRRSLADLENLRIRTPNGGEVPFFVAAEVEYGRGFASISRRDRRRTLAVIADVDAKITTPDEILKSLKTDFLPGLIHKYPGIKYSLEGEQKTQKETMQGLLKGFGLALLVIYLLLAIPFRSYIQPFIVMSAIPFGIIGALWGHLLLGFGLTILSMFGIVALTGVVVNDSLVMVDFINRARLAGKPMAEAIRDAGVARFRPILLTSITTFLGLMPLLFETSVQAQFLIPMAISLGFGVLFATFITLILVPVIYRSQEDAKVFFQQTLKRLKRIIKNLLGKEEVVYTNSPKT
jgi:multidrug efflux pump subunit AcrB